jgi:hypothetical protein
MRISGRPSPKFGMFDVAFCYRILMGVIQFLQIKRRVLDFLWGIGGRPKTVLAFIIGEQFEDARFMLFDVFLEGFRGEAFKVPEKSSHIRRSRDQMNVIQHEHVAV